jgi:RNA polymerase sigma-70 factor, ECF subfamily
MTATVPSSAAPGLDAESRAWLRRLQPQAPGREAAVAELRALLLKAARFEIGRRSAALGRSVDGEDLAQQSADDALMALLGKLGDFRGDSRFTTWAYKFALYEAAVKVRRQAWRGREIPLEHEGWAALGEERRQVEHDAQTRELLSSLRSAIASELSAQQREVLVAVALNDVPIDVLAQRLGKSRGALYKTLHDARRKLRALLLDDPADREEPHE